MAYNYGLYLHCCTCHSHTKKKLFQLFPLDLSRNLQTLQVCFTFYNFYQNVILCNYFQSRWSRGCSANTFVFKRLGDSSFSFQSLKHHYSQTIGARELTFLEKVYLHNMSHVTCHVSHVTCHVSHDIFSFLYRTMFWS